LNILFLPQVQANALLLLPGLYNVERYEWGMVKACKKRL